MEQRVPVGPCPLGSAAGIGWFCQLLVREGVSGVAYGMGTQVGM